MGYFFKVEKSDLAKVDYDFQLLCWYSALKNYAGRFKTDRNGFVRLSASLFESDLGVNRQRAWRLNKKLVELGLIEYHRGKGGWSRDSWGVKILK